jgi:hypothetical protein
MWTEFRKQNALCVEYREALEDLPAEVGEVQGQTVLKNSLSVEALAHATGCESCREASETFWTSRELLAGRGAMMAEDSQATAKIQPWFAAQVMAKIAERETEIRAGNVEWTGAVTRLASRLAWVSALALLVAGTLVYDPQPRTETSARVSQSAGEPQQYLFDSVAGQSSVDDALAGPVER